MKRYLGLTLFLLVAACGLHAQVTDTTVCAVLKAPQSFDGKMVRIKGTVVVSFDQFMIHDADCGLDVNGIWISYPQGTKGKAGPEAMVVVGPAHNFAGTAAAARTPVTLEKSKDFKEFENLLTQEHSKGTGLCMGCWNNQVTATLVGRLDGVAHTELKHDASGKVNGLGGFGNMNAYPARLVLQSVSEVAAKPEDYSKIDALAKGVQDNAGSHANAQPTGEVDPFEVNAKLAAAMGASPLGAQITRDMAVFPKPKTPPTNVSYGYGTINEVAANDGALGAEDSPDGALYVCTFKRDKIKEEALPFAFIHMGQHIVDLQRVLPANEDAPPYVLEYNSWVATTEVALATGQKFVTLPGGYIIWNYKWAKDDQVPNMGSALTSFMGQEEMMNK